MEKRFQVFLSSTYADLKDERQKVIQTLMEMDCIPSGMELFPAVDEEQWEFIKKVIDDCDYYLLIIGGRYGSTTPEGVSFTEKEYDYAIEKGIKVIAFLHEIPETLPVNKTDKNPELEAKLQEFRKKVQENRLIRYWKNPEQLPGLVSLSLSKTIKTYPAIGWVRGSSTASSELLAEINKLRKENDELKAKVEQLGSQAQIPVPSLADIESEFELCGTYKLTISDSSRKWNHLITWKELFTIISPFLLEVPNDQLMKSRIATSVLDHFKKDYYEAGLNEHVFQTIKIQLMAYGLCDVKYLQTTSGQMALFWSITPKGRSFMIQNRTIKMNSHKS